ncbi:MAG TPA: CDP-alcohol phosphatidyltransferase family protein [Candidatus Kryptonia bacterium]
MFEELRVEKRWTVSNLLSLSRIVLLVPVVVLIMMPGNEHRLAVLALMLAAAATDFFDGLLARMLNQVTDFGRLLDPAADKICIIVASVALVIAGDVPLWFVVVVALRDVAIVIGSSLIMTRRKVVVQSVWAGKITTTLLASYIILATIRVESLGEVKSVFLYLSVIFVCFSFGVYLRIYQKLMAQDGIA